MKKYNNTSSIKRLYKALVKLDKKIILQQIIYTICNVVYPFFAIILPKLIIDEILKSNPSTKYIIIICAGFFILSSITFFIYNYTLELCKAKSTYCRMLYFTEIENKLMSMDYANTYDTNFLNKYEKALNSCNSNNTGVELILTNIIYLPPLIITIVILSLLIGNSSIYIIIALVINTLMTIFVNLKTQKYEYSYKEKFAQQTRKAHYFDTTCSKFENGKDIRLFNLKDRIIKNLKLANQKYVKTFTLLANKKLLLGITSLLTLLISDLCTYGILTYQVFKEGMPISDYSMYLTAVATLAITLSLFQSKLLASLNELLYVNDLFIFLDSNLYTSGGEILAPKGNIEIEFKDVTFKYPNTDINIYTNFNLKINALEKIALIGINGAGKTTLIKLMTGLYYPDSGKVLINGIDTKDLNKRSLYDMYSSVMQDIIIFPFTVAQNIACSTKNINRDLVIKCLKDVKLDEYILSLEKGIDSMMSKLIDDQAIELSGGQKQKIALARSLYRNAQVVILDEPTSALDALAEQKIYNDFANVTNNKTSIFVSHRLASTKFCDRIVLLDKQGIKEMGTHDSLMELKQEYYKMFVTQGKYYQTGEHNE